LQKGITSPDKSSEPSDCAFNQGFKTIMQLHQIQITQKMQPDTPPTLDLTRVSPQPRPFDTFRQAGDSEISLSVTADRL